MKKIILLILFFAAVGGVSYYFVQMQKAVSPAGKASEIDSVVAGMVAESMDEQSLAGDGSDEAGIVVSDEEAIEGLDKTVDENEF
jgi:hypothetical protein